MLRQSVGHVLLVLGFVLVLPTASAEVDLGPQPGLTHTCVTIDPWTPAVTIEPDPVGCQIIVAQEMTAGALEFAYVTWQCLNGPHPYQCIRIT